MKKNLCFLVKTNDNLDEGKKVKSELWPKKQFSVKFAPYLFFSSCDWKKNLRRSLYKISSILIIASVVFMDFWQPTLKHNFRKNNYNVLSNNRTVFFNFHWTVVFSAIKQNFCSSCNVQKIFLLLSMMIPGFANLAHWFFSCTHSFHLNCKHIRGNFGQISNPYGT